MYYERNQLNLRRRRALQKLSLMQNVIAYRKTQGKIDLEAYKNDFSKEIESLKKMLTATRGIEHYMEYADYDKLGEIYSKYVRHFKNKAEENRRMLIELTRAKERGNKKSKYFRMKASEFKMHYQEALGEKYKAMAAIKRHIQNHSARIAHIKKYLEIRTRRDHSGNITCIYFVGDQQFAKDIDTSADIARYAYDVLAERALIGAENAENT